MLSTAHSQRGHPAGLAVGVMGSRPQVRSRVGRGPSSSCLWAGGAAFRADVCPFWKESTPHCNMGDGWPLGACCCACPEQHCEDQEVLTNTGVFVEIDVHPCCSMVHVPNVPTQNPA